MEQKWNLKVGVLEGVRMNYRKAITNNLAPGGTVVAPVTRRVGNINQG